MGNECLTIVAAVNDMNVLQKNLFLSPGLRNDGKNQIIIKRGYPSASLAYNEAIGEAENEIILFVHQDVYLPDRWFVDLERSIAYLEEEKINWGVLGCFGTRERLRSKKEFGLVYSNGWGVIGREIDKPEPVQAVDEIVLIIKKSSRLQFDPSLPHFHLYGTDICLSARERGMTSFAIPAYCIHNTNQLLSLPKEFYECYEHIKRRWGKYLPIRTPCIRISRFDRDLHKRRVQELLARLRHKEATPLYRVEDPRSLMKAVL